MKQKWKTRVKNNKQQNKKENTVLINKSAVLEEEAALLKLHVNREETLRRNTEINQSEWRTKNRELEISCATFEEEVRIQRSELQRSELHALNCTLSARRGSSNATSEVVPRLAAAALTVELQHASRAQQHYERMYRTLDMQSRAEETAQAANTTHPILSENVLSSTPKVIGFKRGRKYSTRLQTNDLKRGSITFSDR